MQITEFGVFSCQKITEFGVFSCQKSRNSEFFLVENHGIQSFQGAKMPCGGIISAEQPVHG